MAKAAAWGKIHKYPGKFNAECRHYESVTEENDLICNYLLSHIVYADLIYSANIGHEKISLSISPLGWSVFLFNDPSELCEKCIVIRLINIKAIHPHRISI